MVDKKVIQNEAIFAQDMPRITQAKQEWEATVDALPQLICLLNEAGHVIRANRTVERWQLAPINEISNYTLHQLLHGDCNKESCQVSALWDSAVPFLKAGNSYTIEIEDVVRECVYEIQILPVSNTQISNSSFASIIINDITVRREMEDAVHEHLLELHRLNQEIKDLEQIKTDMIRLASHDLRNPLASIMLSADLIRRYNKNPLPEFQQRHLDKILASSNNMKSIIDNILSLERIENLHQHKMTTVDLTPIVKKVIHKFQAQVDSKLLTVCSDSPDEKVCVAGEATILEEIMTNFVSNAVKYTPNKGRIDIHLNVVANKAEFKVIDTGMGIPHAEQAHIFDPFYRASTAILSEINGIGVGLNVTRNMIERLKGEVIFESIVNEGSTFGFALPTVEIC